MKSRPAHRLNTYITKCICETCNNGWMSELESWFQRNFGPLVEPDWLRLAAEVLRQGLAEHDQLAKWALKTAITMDCNTLTKNVIDDACAKELDAGKLPDGLIVEIGNIADRGIGGIVLQGFWVRMAEDGQNGRSTEKSRPSKW